MYWSFHGCATLSEPVWPQLIQPNITCLLHSSLISIVWISHFATFQSKFFNNDGELELDFVHFDGVQVSDFGKTQKSLHVQYKTLSMWFYHQWTAFVISEWKLIVYGSQVYGSDIKELYEKWSSDAMQRFLSERGVIFKCAVNQQVPCSWARQMDSMNLHEKGLQNVMQQKTRTMWHVGSAGSSQCPLTCTQAKYLQISAKWYKRIHSCMRLLWHSSFEY